MRIRNLIVLSAFLFVTCGCFEVFATLSPYAAEVVEFVQGPGAAAGYDNPQVVVGEPPSVAGAGSGWESPVTITSAPWQGSEVVSLGDGGYITIKFDHKVLNNPAEVEYGIDLLIFGNSFFATDWAGDGTINGTYFEPAKIEVSQDGVNFYTVADVYADALYPYTASKGDFVHATPAGISYMGRNPADVEADFGFGCGGAQVDISKAIGTSAELAWIQYVRVTDIAGDSGIADVVGFADVVPEPAAIMLLLGGSLILRQSKR